MPRERINDSHINSVTKFPNGAYLLSARHIDAIYKISQEGHIVLRLGGSNSDFRMLSDSTFSASVMLDHRCKLGRTPSPLFSTMPNARDSCLKLAGFRITLTSTSVFHYNPLYRNFSCGTSNIPFGSTARID